MQPYTLPPWIDEMIAAMAAYVHEGCTKEEAAQIGSHVGAVAATLYRITPSQGSAFKEK